MKRNPKTGAGGPVAPDTLPLRAYALAMGLLEPLAPAVLRARARRGKEDAARLGERMGHASLPRPPGRLVWLHGASVGEGLSLLPLVQALRAQDAALRLLVTSGTATSARLLGERLPAGAVHQYVPLDAPGAAARFLAHWRPDLAVFVESELWPTLLTRARAGGAPTALVSARLSASSLRGWRRAPRTAARLLAFDLLLAQDDACAQALAALRARVDGRLNLKLAGEPLPADPVTLSEAEAAIAGRPVLLAASTHPGEEALALDVFAWLKARPDRPLLVIAPRHPVRGAEIADMARGEGFATARRAAGDPLTGAVEVYVADTLGELGLWFRLARAALIGGSLVEGIGGHNPFEAARLGCPAISGRHVAAWASVYAALESERAVRMVSGSAALAGAFAEALADPVALRDEAARAAALSGREARAVEAAAARLLALIDRTETMRPETVRLELSRAEPAQAERP